MGKKNSKKSSEKQIAENESLGELETKRLNDEVNKSRAEGRKITPVTLTTNNKQFDSEDILKNVDFMPIETLREMAVSSHFNKKQKRQIANAIKDAEKRLKEDKIRNKKEQKKYEKAVKSGKAEEDPFNKKFKTFDEVEHYFIERDAEICAYILDSNPQFLKNLILSDDIDLVDFVCYINKEVFTKVDFNALHLTYDANKLDNFRIVAKELLTDHVVLDLIKHSKYKDELNLLEVAIADGRNEYIEVLLTYGYPLDNFYEDEYIFQAINADNLEALKLLADHGANLNIKYDDGATLLQRLATVNDMEKFMALLIRGADYKNTNLPDQDLITYLHNNNRNDFRAEVLHFIKNDGNTDYNGNFKFLQKDDYDDVNQPSNDFDDYNIDFQVNKPATNVNNDKPTVAAPATVIGSTDEALRIQNHNTKLELEKKKLEQELMMQKNSNVAQTSQPTQPDDGIDYMEGLQNDASYDRNRAMRVKKVSQYVSPHMIPDPERARRIREELKATPRPTNNAKKLPETNFNPSNLGFASRQIPPMSNGYTGRVPNRATSRNQMNYNYQGYNDRLVAAGIGVTAKNDNSASNNGDFGYEERVKYDLLRHLKILFDEEVITYDEYVLEKSKILGHFEQ